MAKSAPFPHKCYQLIDDPETRHIVDWTEDGAAFVVHNAQEFGQQCLHTAFNHANFSSFVRQLNTFGFKRVPNTKTQTYSHQYFRRGQRELLALMTRGGHKSAGPLLVANFALKHKAELTEMRYKLALAELQKLGIQPEEFEHRAMEQIRQAQPNLETFASMMPNDAACAATSQQRTGASRKRRAVSRTADAATAEAEGEEDSDCEGETDSLSTKGSSGELRCDSMGAPVATGQDQAPRRHQNHRSRSRHSVSPSNHASQQLRVVLPRLGQSLRTSQGTDPSPAMEAAPATTQRPGPQGLKEGPTLSPSPFESVPGSAVLRGAWRPSGAGEQRSPAVSLDVGMDIGGSTDTSATGTTLAPTQLPLPQGSTLRGTVSNSSSCLGGAPAPGPRLVDMGSREASLRHMADKAAPALRATPGGPSSPAGQSVPEPRHHSAPILSFARGHLINVSSLAPSPDPGSLQQQQLLQGPALACSGWSPRARSNNALQSVMLHQHQWRLQALLLEEQQRQQQQQQQQQAAMVANPFAGPPQQAQPSWEDMLQAQAAPGPLMPVQRPAYDQQVLGGGLFTTAEPVVAPSAGQLGVSLGEQPNALTMSIFDVPDLDLLPGDSLDLAELPR